MDDEKISPEIRALSGYEEAKRKIEFIRRYTTPKPPQKIPPERWVRGEYLPISFYND